MRDDRDADCVERGEAQGNDLPRRGLLLRAMLAMQALTAALLAAPAVRFFLTPLGVRGGAGEWVKLCSSAEVPVGAPVGLRYAKASSNSYRPSSDRALAWVARRDGGLVAFSAVCTHLGCSVAWDGKKNGFACPCHGGLFSPAGHVQAGPPARSLARLAVKEEGGSIWICPPGGA